MFDSILKELNDKLNDKGTGAFMISKDEFSKIISKCAGLVDKLNDGKDIGKETVSTEIKGATLVAYEMLRSLAKHSNMTEQEMLHIAIEEGILLYAMRIGKIAAKGFV